jgi:hypothetical protein
VHTTAAVSRLTKGALLDEERKKEAFKAISIIELQKMRDQNIPISMVTAYDYPSGLPPPLVCLRISLCVFVPFVCLFIIMHICKRTETHAKVRGHAATGTQTHRHKDPARRGNTGWHASKNTCQGMVLRIPARAATTPGALETNTHSPC